jgi:hypothetical protein
MSMCQAPLCFAETFANVKAPAAIFAAIRRPKAATDRHMRIVASLIQNSHAGPREGHQVGGCLMILTDRDDTRVTETDEEILVFDVSDDALERTATIIGGQATPVTLVYGTSILGNCACPV